MVELITVSGMHQQFADGQRIGAYPDSISKFELRNPAFLNPEDILVNVLALKGHDPDVKTARLKVRSRELVLSSGATIDKLEGTAAGVRFQLNFFAGEYSHALITGLRPEAIRVNAKLLPESKTPLRREPGWWWDEKAQRIYLTVLQEQARVQVEIQ
jgi:hypothetical protein